MSMAKVISEKDFYYLEQIKTRLNHIDIYYAVLILQIKGLKLYSLV